MEPQKQIENGEEFRLHFVLPLVGGGRGNPTATIRLLVMEETQQAQFDTEFTKLLAEMAKQFVTQGE